MDRKNYIGQRIRKARKEAKPQITQVELIARLEILGVFMNQASLSKVENGNRPVSDIEVKAFAEALKVPVSWLFEKS